MRRAVARRLAAERESGMTLVEVIVAMFIFALLSSGVIYGMISVLTLTRDSRAREVAANLAAQRIDLARDTADLFALLDSDTSTTLNGDTFNVHVASQWVSDPSKDFVCGAGGSSLRYKRVNVTVTWDNMRKGTDPVRSDTVIQPEAKINDPAKGTILVSVLGAAGQGVGGVTVSAVPSSTPNGATTLTTSPSATDAQGCSYILKVSPGNYDVTVTKSGYVGVDQATTATSTVVVAAGEAASALFQYDAKANYNLTYASTYTAAPTETVRVPAIPTSSFVSTYGTFVVDPGSATSLTRSVGLHPFASGYQIFAGSCLAADPESWPDGIDGGGAAISGVRSAGIAAAPGSSVAAAVPMGVVKLSLGTSAGNRYLKAVSAAGPAGSGDPGCATTVTYSFGSAAGYGVPANGAVTVALPYGSWKLYTGTSANAADWTTAVTPAQMSLPAVPVPSRSSIAPTGIVTFDPRVPTP